MRRLYRQAEAQTIELLVMDILTRRDACRIRASCLLDACKMLD
jgi:hypothetical protein